MDLQQSHFTFFYPFSYRQNSSQDFVTSLKKSDYHFFNLDAHKEQQLYSEGITISPGTLRQFFYPFIEDKLLPTDFSLLHFNRYCKQFHIDGVLFTEFEQIDFKILSADVLLCPFGIGLVAIRTELLGPCEISSALQFAHFFRMLEATRPEHKLFTLTVDGHPFDSIQQCIHLYIVPHLENYYVDYSFLGGNKSKLPFFDDERMYVAGFLLAAEDEIITNDVLFRCGQLNGVDSHGNPYISSSNPDYIARYVKQHILDRWAPNHYVVVTTQSQMTISNRPLQETQQAISSFYGTNYYNVLLHYFYKMMLLKLSFEHSELKWKKGIDVIEELIEQITKFGSRYYFIEVAVRAGGQEISKLLRSVFRIDEQYVELKAALNELYRVQEDRAQDRQNELLFLLTVFSMISGIFGMNLVIDQLGAPIDWAKVSNYTFFEWIASILTIIGVLISGILVLTQGYSRIRSFIVKKQRKRKQ